MGPDFPDADALLVHKLIGVINEYLKFQADANGNMLGMIHVRVVGDSVGQTMKSFLNTAERHFPGFKN